MCIFIYIYICIYVYMYIIYIYIPVFELMIKQGRLSAHSNHAICSFGTLKLDSST